MAKPSSLHHYTSMSTLVALFNGIGKSKDDEQDNRLYFTFHATNAFQMNDKIEGTMLLDKFFTGSKIKTEYKKLYDQLEKDEGKIYIISLCSSSNESKDAGYIPMWSMYGNKGNGAILVFDFEKLEEYVSQHQNLSLKECQYIKSQELKTFIQKKNQEMREDEDIKKMDLLSSLRIEAFELKDWHWEYESEWRILVKSNDSKLKTNNGKAISYTEVQIPVNCLSAIIIGPLVEFDIIERLLNKKISELHKLDNNIKIGIKPSKLQIR